MTVELQRRFARNNAWSNHRLLTACGKLSEDDYKAARTSFFPSLHLTLNHILLVDWYYYDALTEAARWSFTRLATSLAQRSPSSMPHSARATKSSSPSATA